MAKINVLGLGPSLDLFIPNGDITIGVNDIWSKIKTDYVVCVDKKECFFNEPERLKTINECKPINFYTHFPIKDKPEENDWSDRPDYQHIELQPYYPNYECNVNTKQIAKSSCSPFIATVIAYKFLGATEINVYGVDLINHPNLDRKQCEKIKLHFRNLKIALRMNGCELIVYGNGILKNLS
jgi:hypothetical protein